MISLRKSLFSWMNAAMAFVSCRDSPKGTNLPSRLSFKFAFMRRFVINSASSSSHTTSNATVSNDSPVVLNLCRMFLRLISTAKRIHRDARHRNCALHSFSWISTLFTMLYGTFVRNPSDLTVFPLYRCSFRKIRFSRRCVIRRGWSFIDFVSVFSPSSYDATVNPMEITHPLPDRVCFDRDTLKNFSKFVCPFGNSVIVVKRLEVSFSERMIRCFFDSSISPMVCFVAKRR